MKFEEKIERFISKHGLLRKDSTVLVALSGGADSVALLLVLRELGYDVTAAHCNFHLRGEESDRDEQFVRDLCRKTQTPLHIEQFNTNAEAAAKKESIEMAARRLRYEWFSQLCRENGYCSVAVAHHRDDNIETFFLNLLRGTSLRGLSGMRPKRDNIVRPLLCVSRSEIEDWLEKRHQGFVTDSTNSDTKYRRNKIRHELLPLLRELNPSFDDGLTETMQRLQAVEVLENKMIMQRTENAVSILDDGIAIDATRLREDPFAEIILFRLLRPYGFAPAVIEDVARRLDKPEGKLYEEGDYLLSCNPRTIEVRRRPLTFEEVEINDGGNLLPDGSILNVKRLNVEDIPVPEGHSKSKKRFATPPNVAYIDSESIEGRLICRSIKPGDRFTPFGMHGSKLINDFLTEKGYSRIDRIAAKVVCDDKKILWVVGARTAACCAVSENTKEILRITKEQSL